MPVQGDLESKAIGEEANLTAEEAQGVGVDVDVGVHVGIDVTRDPCEARADSETLGGDGRSRGQQPAEGEEHHGGLAHRARANGWHV